MLLKPTAAQAQLLVLYTVTSAVHPFPKIKLDIPEHPVKIIHLEERPITTAYTQAIVNGKRRMSDVGNLP
jgi:hypothetical protein